MQEPPHYTVRHYERRIQEIHPDLRVCWGERDYGIERWVVQRRLPADVHAACLEEFAQISNGADRVIDQKLTDDDGNVTRTRRFDMCGEWALGHIIENNEFALEDPRGYRVPDERDIATIWHWVHDYRNIEEQIREVQSERASQKEKQQQERIGHIAREFTSFNSHIFGDEFIDKPAQVKEGTEL